MNSNRKFAVNCDRETVLKFEEYYPHLKEIFLTRCLKYAIISKEFFEEVFFNEDLMEIK